MLLFRSVGRSLHFKRHPGCFWREVSWTSASVALGVNQRGLVTGQEVGFRTQTSTDASAQLVNPIKMRGPVFVQLIGTNYSICVFWAGLFAELTCGGDFPQREERQTLEVRGKNRDRKRKCTWSKSVVKVAQINLD